MAKIYSKANRVIVWLGGTADDSDRAVEEIRVAAGKQSTYFSTHETLQKAIVALLRRPWFRRIWVLQEVAAARHVRIICGPMDIDGYAFCSGLESLKHFYEALPDLQNLIPSVIYLIKGAIFRPDYQTGSSGSVSLDICPLGELIDMFHTHEATLRHDKVYALLGMSSDNTSAAGLSPDYTVPWNQLFQRLVKSLLCQEISVGTWGDRETAVIKSKGCILGQVSSEEQGNSWGDTRNLHITSRDTSTSLGYRRKWSARWTSHASAKPIRQGDLVCLLQGAPKPAIIRTCKDHFAVIMIAVTPTEYVETESGIVRWSELLQTITIFPHDFLLVWNWEKSPRDLQYQTDHETMIKTNSRAPEHLKTSLEVHLGKATRLWNVALILEDLEEYQEAEERLRVVIEGCESAFGKESPSTLISIDKLALIYKKKQQWKQAEDLFVHVIEKRKQVQGADHLDTLRSMTNLASTYRAQGYMKEEQKLKIMIYLLERGEDNVQITERAVVQIAKSFDEEVMKLLLERRGGEIQITENVVKAAAANSRSGNEVMMLLLKRRGGEVQITEGAVVQIAKSFNEEVMKLLLRRRGGEVEITENVVEAAAANLISGKEVMMLLLERTGGKVQITERIVEAATANWRSGKEVIMLLLERRRDEVHITEGLVAQIAKSFDEEVMKLLLERQGGEIQITKRVVEAAAANLISGKEVMMLLLERRGGEVRITEKVVEAALENSRSGKEVMQLLFKRRGNDEQITEDVDSRPQKRPRLSLLWEEAVVKKILACKAADLHIKCY
ncbi:hypothetical protein K469DRAFT_651037 [Zopfia rhizophila CBS 207.26]|uniref:Heterokaryon incompatibility domain-containing protein n=1 Tax=Zopfia rhizophila CBS 207.26 TaxID=1314779 RepID=A0A6A6ESH0_9PEZI|nr:hypothetical protein K469DRAFT_651037 [Zopfia rhizophila CBS 207.26]